ncbi:MAG: hypothetical protein Q7S58_05920, partial [Candidatus Binatus sp.]|nr:hypothetical protein [Candidatus Binatus sp.]
MEAAKDNSLDVRPGSDEADQGFWGAQHRRLVQPLRARANVENTDTVSRLFYQHRIAAGSVAKLVEKKKSVMIRRVEPQLAPAWRRVPEDDAMESDSRSGGEGKATLEALMRERIRATIETIVDEELGAALGAARSQRVGEVRAGYRH